MSYIINNTNDKSNIPNSEIKSAINPELLRAKKAYDDFVDKVNKSDFCNSPQRYIAELTFVRKLKDFYMKHQNLNLLQEITEREKEILEKLKNEFGITFKTN